MHAVDKILDLFARGGGDKYFGERVSQREHALQTASLAEAAGAAEALVVAALVHDVGHLLQRLPESIALRGIDGRHEIAGAAWLSRAFPPQVTEPIRLHVAAKRYLSRVEPEYGLALSPASRRSLELQGGPFAADEAAGFERESYHRDAVELRRWDDEAKIVGKIVPTVEHYLERLRRQTISG